MKNKCIAILLIGALILQNACTVRIPVAGNKQQLHNSAERISNPYYSVKKRKTGWFVTPLISGAYGVLAYYGMKASQKKKDPTLTNEELHKKGMGPAIMGGTLVMLTGIGVSVSNKGSRYKTESVSTRQFDQWLNDYSKKEKQKYTKYQENGSSYLVIPGNNITAYEAEERRIKEEAERKKAEYERAVALKKQQEEDAAEKKAYEEVMKNTNKKYWIEYLTKFPNGRNIEKVKEEAERKARFDLAFNDTGAWGTYVKYFPESENIQLVKSFEKLSKKWDTIMDGIKIYTLKALYDYNELPYVVIKDKLEAVNDLKNDLNLWNSKFKDNTDYDIFVEQLTLRLSASSQLDGVIVALNYLKDKGDKRKESARKFVKGDNLCLTLNAVNIDEKGEKIKGTDHQTLIRLTIDDLNEDRSRVKVTVKEIYDLNNKKKIGSFTFTNPRRVWQVNNADWIDPADWDLEYCK